MHRRRRLAREGLTNARRHAVAARRVVIEVDGTADPLHVSIRDDGEESDGPAVGGYGLKGLAERVQLLGGRFEAGPLRGGGWQIAAALPRAAAS